MLGRQLHKRRLLPAPRPFLLQPIADSPVPAEQSACHSRAPVYDIHGRRQRTQVLEEELGELHADAGIPTGVLCNVDASSGDAASNPLCEIEANPHDCRDLGLDLLALPDCVAASVVCTPSLGESPRKLDKRRDSNTPANIDAEWVNRTVGFSKPDGRQYRLHQKRHRPPPQPVLAPSVYAKELAPGYTARELAKRTPGFKGHQQKHDLVTYFTTGEVPPGPTLGEMAAKAKPLQSRLQEIHNTNHELVDKVETLWRLRQSWGMTRPEINQWKSPLERPHVLRQAPGRHFRNNILLHDLAAPEDGFEFTPGTLFRKGNHSIPIVGRWSIFKGEPSGEGEAPPENFNSREQVAKEMRRHQRVQGSNTMPEVILEDSGVDVGRADELMQTLMTAMTDIEMDITSMQHDLGTNEQPEVKSDDEVEEGTKNADTTLSEDITMLQNRLADGKAHKKVKGTGHIFLGNGEVKEVAIHEDAMDGGGEDDDLEDRIKKPKQKRMNPHRDCFNPLSKTSVHR